MGLSSIERQSLARKGLLLFGVLAVAQLVFAGVLIVVDRARTRDLAAERVVRREVFAAHVTASELIDLQVYIRGYLVNPDARLLKSFDHDFGAAKAAVARLPSASPAAARMRRAAQAYLALLAGVRSDIAAGRLERAAASIAAPAVALRTEFRAAHMAFNHDQEKRLLQRKAATRGATRGVALATAGGVIANLAFALALGGSLTRSASRRLATILENTRRLQRDEEIGPPMPEGDEISAVDHAFHSMAATLTRQRRELKQINGEVEAFSYSVSHDLRAPLRAVSGYAEMLQEDYGDRLDDVANRYIAAMRSESARMGQLIDDLLRFSRVSRQSLNVQSVDVAALATSCMSELRNEHPDRRINFEIGALPSAEGDPSLIRVVLINLLSNAMKYTLRREVAVIRLTGEIEGWQCVFHVEDNGVGFDMRYASKLFAVFQRLHRDDEFEGTGVGLALVARIVERHGGRVTATGTVGSGATFTFTLPATAEVRDVA